MLVLETANILTLDHLESRNNEAQAGYDAKAPEDTVAEIRTILLGLLKTLEKRGACTQAQLNLIRAGCAFIISDLIPSLESEFVGVENEIVTNR